MCEVWILNGNLRSKKGTIWMYDILKYTRLPKIHRRLISQRKGLRLNFVLATSSKIFSDIAIGLEIENLDDEERLTETGVVMYDKNILNLFGALETSNSGRETAKDLFNSLEVEC